MEIIWVEIIQKEIIWLEKILLENISEKFIWKGIIWLESILQAIIRRENIWLKNYQLNETQNQFECMTASMSYWVLKINLNKFYYLFTF